MKLEGQNALVTGASRGIGRGCAMEMAKAGANVAINYRSHPEEAEEAAEEARSYGVKAITIQADVADQKSVEKSVEKVVEEFGSLDLFVSNSAYSDRELILDADMEGFKRTIDQFSSRRDRDSQFRRLQYGQSGNRPYGKNRCHRICPTQNSREYRASRLD